MRTQHEVGELYAGIGGLSLAILWALGVEPAWQLDICNERVRARHFPDALQVHQDVRALSDPDGNLTERGRARIESLPPVGILAGGFSCQDLSTAGTRSGFGGERTGPTYRAMLHFVEVLRPPLVVLENVPRLLSRHREKLEADFGALGYGLSWIKSRADHTGSPHLRRRVFVVAELGHDGLGVLDTQQLISDEGARLWPTPVAADAERTSAYAAGNPSLTSAARLWPTPLAADAEAVKTQGPGVQSLTGAVRLWPTPTASDANAAGSRSLEGSKAHAGTSLTDAVRPDRATAERPWATPRASDDERGAAPSGSRDGAEGLAEQAQVRNWATATATATATDYKSASEGQRRGQLGDQIGGRLNPDWVEILQGFPAGWTDVDSWQLGLFAPKPHRLIAEPRPRWPRGRYPKSWDRSTPWPGHDWEPPRTIQDGPPVPGRPARLRGIGNAVCPQEGDLALATWRAARGWSP